MPYTVYKVTNLVTLDFYIGVHKTDDPNDAYLGSGKVIREQVARYGPENFRKVILNSFGRRKDAYRLEAEMVNPLLGTPGCLNLHPGGHGGFGYINTKGLNNCAGNCYRARRVLAVRISTDETLRAAMRERMEFNRTLRDPERLRQTANHAASVWRGQHHAPEVVQRMSDQKLGAKNKVFGTKLLHHPSTGEHRRLAADAIPQALEEGWVLGWAPRIREHLSGVPHVQTKPRCSVCANSKRHLRPDGLCAPCWRAAQVVAAHQLITSGVSHSEAARAVQLNRTALYKHLKAMGL